MAKYKTEVIQDKILGTDTEDTNIYMVFWERAFNSGYYLIYAKDEIDAMELIGYNPEYCKLTAIKLDRENMPITAGKRN